MIAEVWAGLLLGIAGVVATNVDNFLVLVGVFGTRSGSRTAVRLGFCVGALILLVISLIFSFIGELIPIRFLGYLGVIPISMGVLELSRQDSSTARAQSRSGPASQGFTKSVVTVSILTLAGGTDTFAVIAPLLAESQSIAVAAICSGYVIAVIGIPALLAQAVSHLAFGGEAGGAGPERPRILERLQPGRRGRLLSLSAEDHYVRVRGEALERALADREQIGLARRSDRRVQRLGRHHHELHRVVREHLQTFLLENAILQINRFHEAGRHFHKALHFSHFIGNIIGN